MPSLNDVQNHKQVGQQAESDCGNEGPQHSKECDCSDMPEELALLQSEARHENDWREKAVEKGGR